MAFAAASHVSISARNFADRRRGQADDDDLNSARLSTGRGSARQSSRHRFRRSMSVLDNYIDSIQTDSDKERIKQYMKTLYTEALNVEIV